jgi:hypothetical protein
LNNEAKFFAELKVIGGTLGAETPTDRVFNFISGPGNWGLDAVCLSIESMYVRSGEINFIGFDSCEYESGNKVGSNRFRVRSSMIFCKRASTILCKRASMIFCKGVSTILCSLASCNCVTIFGSKVNRKR